MSKISKCYRRSLLLKEKGPIQTVAIHPIGCTPFPVPLKQVLWVRSCPKLPRTWIMLRVQNVIPLAVLFRIEGLRRRIEPITWSLKVQWVIARRMVCSAMDWLTVSEDGSCPDQVGSGFKNEIITKRKHSISVYAFFYRIAFRECFRNLEKFAPSSFRDKP